MSKGIGIEQIDKQSFNSMFYTKDESGKPIMKESVKEAISSLTLFEKEEIGLIEVSIIKSKFYKLINTATRILNEAVIGTEYGMHNEPSATMLRDKLLIATTYLNIYDETELENQYNILYTEFRNFLRSRVIWDGILLGDTYYGTKPTVEEYTTWIKGELIDNKYWISTTELPIDFPNRDNITQIYGTFMESIVFTRHPIPDDLYLPLVIGNIVYGDFYFSETDDEYMIEVGSFENANGITLVESEYREVLETDPLWTQNGTVWVGSSVDLEKLPSSQAELQRVFNVIAAVGE